MNKRKSYKIISHHEGVTSKAMPFFVKAKNKNDSLVIITHGFTSSPYHMHDMADFLAEHGYDSQAVLLAGHGGNFDRLKNTDASDWQKSLDQVIELNKDRYKNIFLIGFSFGGNLSLHTANKYNFIKGVAILSIPIFLKKEKRIRFFLPLARIFKKRYKKRWMNKDHWPVLEERGHHSHIPIKGIVDFYSFIDNMTKKELFYFDKPVLIIHSKGDTVSSAVSSEYLYKNIKSDNKQLYILNKTSHNLEHESRRDFIFNKIVDFFNKL